MDMTTIICATNRDDARSRVVYEKVIELFSGLTESVFHQVDLRLVDFTLNSDQYESENQSETLSKIQDDYLIPSEKFIFIIPEYNGSFAGIVKYFIDALSIRKYKPTFKGKKALLIGVADGRAGNLRGLDQFSQILMHIGTVVYPNKLPLSRINTLIEEDQLTDEGTLKVLESIMKDFIVF